MKRNALMFLGKSLLCGLVLIATVTNHAFAVENISYTNGEFKSEPVNLSGNNVNPLVMINASRDHQLSYKAYNDFSDLDGDGTPESTYKDSIAYYGYFDNAKCYTYNTTDNRFVPAALATGTNKHYCSGQWSGNFMNWASMTRMDVVRKMLYGGYRSTDNKATDTPAGLTVLERQYLPTEAHAFAKYYDGSDFNQLTPFTAADGILLTPPTAISTTSATIPSDTTITFNSTLDINVGETVRVYRTGDMNNYFMIGTVQSITVGPPKQITISIPSYNSYVGAAGPWTNWTLENLSRSVLSAPSNTANTIPQAPSVTFTTATTLPAVIGDQIKVVQTSDSTKWWYGGVTGVAGLNITIQTYAGNTGGSGPISNWTLTNLSKTGISIANLTRGDAINQFSQSNTNPPLIRVAKGNFALWTANEKWQAYWSGEKSNTQSGFVGGFRSNGNKAYLSGINACAENPSQTTHGLGTGSAKGEYYVRIEVANSSWLGNERVKKYGSTNKPIGLLQVYGDTDQISFGLMTGTYDHNVSGGVLRKNATPFTDEVSSTDGTFKTINGIVYNMNKIRIYGYKYSDGNYITNDNCTYQQTGFVHTGGSVNGGYPATEGNCSSWGNPMSEIYLESLRYLAGKSASVDSVNTLDFSAGTKDTALGLTIASWTDPLGASNYCAPLNVLNFNTSVSSYDGDQMTGMSDLGTTSTAAKDLTDAIGVNEGINGSNWFVGNNGVTSDKLCTSKNMSSGLGAYSGLCSEAPSQQGTYLMAGAANYANIHQIRTIPAIPAARSATRDYEVSTYGIALATNVPKIEVMVNNKKVTILPAYRLDRTDVATGRYGGGTLVDFKIIDQNIAAGTGRFYINWEDSEMGGDYDQDVWGTIKYTVSDDTITITTDAVSASTSNGQGFGYIISGTNHDGAHFHSGILGFDFTDATGGCSNCQVGDPPTSVTYTASGTSAGILNDPLWYTAKYGGFIEKNNNAGVPKPDLPAEWDSFNNKTGAVGADGVPDNFYYATNPLQLENALARVFDDILKRASSGTAAAVVSNNVSGTGAMYQAFYEPARQDTLGNSVSWIGTVQALWLDSYGNIREDNSFDAIGNGKLDDYDIDRVVTQYFDETANKTKIRRYKSTNKDKFNPHYMQGKVTGYDPATGLVQFEINETSGTAGTFSGWTVANLTTKKSATISGSNTILGVGVTVNFSVTPASPPFVSVGDTIKIGHFEYDTVAWEGLKPLWNARKNLSLIADAVPDPPDPSKHSIQRAFDHIIDYTATGGRHIKTWIDKGTSTEKPNGKVDTTEFIDFDAFHTSANYGFFNVATSTDAELLVDYIRGREIAGYRSRTIDYGDGNGVKVMRLGDIVNSTPTIVGEPKEELHLLYKDSTYGAFKKQYANRRQVLYAGSNDGILHAFNGGFYDTATNAFKLSNGAGAVEHPLGAEIWGYVPMNLLPHLKWLKSSTYSHVYYIDGKPRVFDAKIFANDTDHPDGWGTVLIVGMRFGGGPITINVANGTPDDFRDFRSAYVVMDITNPEAGPKLMAELQVPDGTYSTSYPTGIVVKEITSATPNNWFLIFGSGPTSLGTAESSQNAKIYTFPLDQFTTPASMTTAPTGCTWVSNGASTYSFLSCDTGVASSFVGDLISVDWDLDYKTDSVYFGLVGDKTSTSGRVMRFGINKEPDPKDWKKPDTLINTSQPVVSAVTPAIDKNGEKWIFFGTGRFFFGKSDGSPDDQHNTNPQAIYGVKDKDPIWSSTVTTVNKSKLLDVSLVNMKTDGTFAATAGIASTTIKDLEKEIADTALTSNQYKGWFKTLPPIDAGVAATTRVISASPLLGGVLSTAVYQPGADVCTSEGLSDLYALYYMTGTAYPDPAPLGTVITSGIEYARSSIHLGRGYASSPAVHSGSGTGSSAVNLLTQLSTGTVDKTEEGTVTKVRSGVRSWLETSYAH